MRDHLHSRGGRKDSDDEDIARRYRRLFPDLHERIDEFIKERRQAGQQTFADLKDWNYVVFTKDQEAKLGNNPVHTEIDVVLEDSESSLH